MGSSCQSAFTFCRVLQDSRDRRRFSLREGRRIGLFEIFQMNPHNVTYSVGAAEALLLMLLSLNAPYSCGPDVQPQAPGRICPACS